MTKIGIIGCGSIGSFLSIVFKKLNHDVIIIDKTKGCSFKEVNVVNLGKSNISVCNYENLRNEEFDYLIFSVKAYDLNNAIRLVLKNGIKTKMAFSTQNGLFSLEKLERNFKAASMVIYYGVNSIDKCYSKFNGGSKIIVGCKNRSCKNDLLFLSEANKIGLNFEIVDDIEPYRWEKLIVNSSINPVATLFMRNNGYILENKDAYDMAMRIAKENLYIARRLNIKLLNDPIKEIIETIKSTYNNYNSTLQDICKKRKTELHYLNLAIYKLARKKLNYEAKYNYFAYKSVMAIKDLIKNNNEICANITRD